MKTILLLIAICYAIADQSINLRDISALTFTKGKYTTARRTSPIQQLKRVGGSVTDSYEPSVIQCKNTGFDGISVQWQCKGDIDQKYRLGSVEVVCEGYNRPGDSLVLIGSCGLEYTLEYTAKGETRKNRQRKPRQPTYQQRSVPEYVESSNGGILSIVFWIVLLVVLIGVCIFLSGPSYVTTTTPPPYYGPSYNPGFQAYPQTTYVNTDSGFGSGFATGYTVGSINNRNPSHYVPDQVLTSQQNDDDDDDSTTRTNTAFGGTRVR